jgi:transposase-like protein
MKCRIISVGKRRDGGTRFWCLSHRADATAKYGVQAELCRYAHLKPISKKQILTLDVSKYEGGVGLWGAVPPVYDTTRLPLDRGIHVHARPIARGSKEIDKTFRSVTIIDRQNSSLSATIPELDAIYYMVSSIFGYPMKKVVCGHCGWSHLDKDWFSLHPHQQHLCAGCGKYFKDSAVGIGNPIIGIQEQFKSFPRSPKKIRRTKNIRQEDYPGGLQIWGSNLSIFWTSKEHEEEGIHLHAFKDNSEMPTIDDTFAKLTVDGITLDPDMIRLLMAQNALPHLAGRVGSFDCPKCESKHLCQGANAFTPQVKHHCVICGRTFAVGRRKSISNPVIDALARLAALAPQPPQIHLSDLLPETL